MGQPLTWRDVAAPDFNTAMAGYGVAGRNITDAGAALSKGIGEFQTDQQNTAAAQLAAAAAKFPDQKSLMAAQQNGSLLANVGNPGYLTPDAYKIPTNQATTLLSQATSQQALDHNTAMDPLLQKNEAANTASVNSATEGKNISNNLARAGLQDAKDVAHDNALQSILNNKHTNVDWTAKDDLSNDDLKATEATSNIVKSSGSYAKALAAIANMPDSDKTADDAGVDGGTRAKMIARLPALYKQFNPNATDIPGGSAGVGSPLSGASAPVGLSTNTGAGAASNVGQQLAAAANQGTNIPSYLDALPDETQHYVPKILGKAGDLSGMSNEQKAQALLPHLINQEGAHGDVNATSPKGARGITQVMPATGTAPGYGVTPMGAQTKAEQIRFGHDYLLAMLNNYNGDASKALAAYNAGPGSVDAALKQNPYGADNQALLAGSHAQTNKAISLLDDIDTKSNQVNTTSSGVQGNYASTMADTTSDMDAVVAKLQKGNYNEISKRVIVQKLNQIVTESKKEGMVPVTLATAGAILDNTSAPLSGSGSIFDTAGWNPWRDASITGDAAAQTAALKSIGQGDAEKYKRDNASRTASAGLIQSAMAAKTQAQNDLFQEQENARLQPERAGNVLDKRRIFNAKSAALQKLLDASSGKNSPLYKPSDAAQQQTAQELAAAAKKGSTPTSAPTPSSTPVQSKLAAFSLFP